MRYKPNPAFWRNSRDWHSSNFRSFFADKFENGLSSGWVHKWFRSWDWRTVRRDSNSFEQDIEMRISPRTS